MSRALPVTILLLAALSTAAADTLPELIRAGERAAAIEMIRDGADVDAAEGDGTSALHWAVYRMDHALVEMLLERGADPDAVNRYGSSPLAEAVKVADAGLTRMLLEAGADVEAPNSDGQTVLMLAARAGAVESARLLVEHGADVNARERWRGQTALMWAADERQPEITRLLIEHGADVDLRAKWRDWPSQITSEPRAQYRPTGGLTALLYAARSGCPDCAAALIEAGADVNRPNPDGLTPLIVAIDNFAFDTAKLLLDNGANPHTWDWWGRTPLYVAVDMRTHRPRERRDYEPESEATALDVIRILLEAGVNPNPQLNMHRLGRGGNLSRFTDDLLTTGATPLLRAAIGHDVEAARALLDAGALVDLPNVMGVTPLMGAAGIGVGRGIVSGRAGEGEQRAIETVALLLEAGADVNARVVEAYNRTSRIARTSSMTGREGQTALYAAAGFGWADLVGYLIEHGAAVDVVDAHGRSPLDAALGNAGGRLDTAHEDVAEILRAAGARETATGAAAGP